MRRTIDYLLRGKGTIRDLSGPEALLVRVYCVGIIAYHLIMLAGGLWGLEAFTYMATHLGLFLILVFLLFSGGTRTEKHIPILDWGLAALSLALLVYLMLNDKSLMQRADMDLPLQTQHIVLGILTALLVLEATRRVVGVSLVWLTLFFIIYAWYGGWPGLFQHSSISWKAVVDMVSLGTSSAGWGIWSSLLWVSANVILPVIVFGMLMDSAGATSIFFDFANALVGKASGGPAKVAVVGSAAVGTLTGGAPTNVAITGSVTIPAMIRMGYPPHFAGAVESVASTGGAITPPIVGATVFVMADLLQIPFSSLLLPLVIPALLYYLGIFLQVHWETKKLGFKGLPQEEVPALGSVLKNFELYAYLLPLIAFIAAVLQGWTVAWAALLGIGVLLVVYFVISLAAGKPLLSTVSGLIPGAERSAEVTAMVVFAIALAGIIVTAFGESGFAGKFAHLISVMAGNHLFFALLLGAVLSLLLGMGTSVTVAYLIVVLLVTPITIRVGVPPLSAHMFSLYFASMAYITPPVALACYVAASISGANFYRIGWTAMRLGFAAFLVPFLFVYKPALITLGQPWETAFAVGSTAIALFLFSAMFVGWMFRRLSLWERCLFAAVGIGVLNNNYIVSGIFCLFFGLILLWQTLSARSKEWALRAVGDAIED